MLQMSMLVLMLTVIIVLLLSIIAILFPACLLRHWIVDVLKIIFIYLLYPLSLTHSKRKSVIGKCYLFLLSNKCSMQTTSVALHSSQVPWLRTTALLSSSVKLYDMFNNNIMSIGRKGWKKNCISSNQGDKDSFPLTLFYEWPHRNYRNSDIFFLNTILKTNWNLWNVDIYDDIRGINYKKIKQQQQQRQKG